MVGLLSPSALRVVELERPQQVGGILEIRANGVDLVDKVLDTDNVMLLHDVLNDKVIVNGLTVTRNLK